MYTFQQELHVSWRVLEWIVTGSVKLKMINILKWRVGSDTYLTCICRHRWSRKSSVKLYSLPFILYNFHRTLSVPAISTDPSQVGVTLFPSFKNIYHFTFPGFPFISIHIIKQSPPPCMSVCLSAHENYCTDFYAVFTNR